MKTSSPETPKPRQPPSFLFIGPPGGGKSTMLLQWPGLAVADCDLNLDGPERLLRNDCKYPLAYKYETIPFDDSGTALPKHALWPRLIKFAEDSVRDPEVRVIGVDGLTQVDNYLISFVLKEASKPNGQMEIQDWIPFRRELMRLIMTVRISGKWSIFTCHETIEHDRRGNVLKYNPAISSRLKDYFGGLFTDMWRFTALPAANNKQTFTVRPYATSMNELKNSFGIPARDLDLPPGKAFETINKWVKFV